MIEIIITEDGSHTIKNHALNETYHSLHGAMNESLHVFIKHGLEFFLARSPAAIAVLEVGFGTGLNAWLTAKHLAGTMVKLHYIALEPQPLGESVWSQLNYATTNDDQTLFNTLHRVAWNEPVPVTPEFVIHKMPKSVYDLELTQACLDLIYYDAFAPQKQPEMWTSNILAKVAGWLRPGGVLVTYCAKGQVKRDLKAAGLMVEALQGPPGKREMIRALK
ncbi:MAG: tRNA (5-methylaminomethyl-2-thiouridine)(34)-methyltransferase MnmD [Flammeovirgaceae bacterium]|nr:MAG: tRNA (5-methylaminomethyl-2-thiouridine)(34)-methyltransferase MnmD [Flammeovirgaceae bacterium]